MQVKTFKYKSLFSSYDEWFSHFSPFIHSQNETLGKLIYDVMYSQFANCDIMYDTPDLFWIDMAYFWDKSIHELNLKQKFYDTIYNKLPEDFRINAELEINRQYNDTSTSKNKMANTPSQYEYVEDFLTKYVDSMGQTDGNTDGTSKDTHQNKTSYFSILRQMKSIRRDIYNEIVEVYTPLFVWFD